MEVRMGMRGVGGAQNAEDCMGGQSRDGVSAKGEEEE